MSITQRPARSVLTRPPGVRVHPREHSGVGALVVAGSSGRVDDPRAELLARHGVLSESIQWFGGPGQHDGPWEIPLETFVQRIDALATECDRIITVGTSFGSEAALLTANLCESVDVAVAFAASDVVWAGFTDDGRETSHWTYDGTPLPFVPFVKGWQPEDDPPSYRSLYEQSRAGAPEIITAATISTDHIADVVLVAGGDDRVWPAALQARAIATYRSHRGLRTTLVVDDDAGHRSVMPGEPIVNAGARMQRGGTIEADRRLGQRAWAALKPHLEA